MAANSNIVIEGAKIKFPNFSGKEDHYNPLGGRRSFCVILEDESVVQNLIDDGWNVRYLASRDDPEDKVPYLSVAVNFANMPPKVVMLTSNGKVVLSEDTIGQLDYADIENADVVIRPYNWTVNGKTGVKAYLKTLYVTLNIDEFETKYADISESHDENLPF